MARSRKAETQTLKIEEVPKGLLSKVESLAKSKRPETTRNGLIIFLLEELVSGRLVFADVDEEVAA